MKECDVWFLPLRVINCSGPSADKTFSFCSVKAPSSWP